MSPTRRSAANFAILLVLVVAGYWLWSVHAQAWDLGRRSPVLNYDTAQYALAGRELAERGRLATPFALPIELMRPGPPWPLAVVQPGLVVAEAAVFRLMPKVVRIGDLAVFNARVPAQREWLTLVLPFCCFLTLGVLLALVTARLLERHAPETSPIERRLAGLTIGLAFLLDPEAQHFAVGGFTEMPFALGLAGAFTALIADRAAPQRPLLFGLLLGITGAFRANMLWLAPVLAVAAAALAPPERRLRVVVLALFGYALPLAPWWFYKWSVFGTPGWDLTRLVVWEGVEGRSWFSLFHLPEQPVVPHGIEAARLLALKTVSRLPQLLLALATGPRALWTGALLLWILLCRPARPLAVAGWSILAATVLGMLAAAITIPWLRFLFPTRVPLEAAGTLALWGLIASAPTTLIGPRMGRALKIGVAALAIGWGVSQTVRGNAEARATAAQRGVPSVLTLRDLAHRLRQEVPANEVVMSNLGPMLAWYAERPVVHLALTPADVGACRRRLEFRHVLLAFRDADQAWPGWQEVVARPDDAPALREWNVTRVRHWQELDGFQIVWLELGPPEPSVAARQP